MATFEERAERLKKELEEATNDDQRRNLSREYELTLRLLRIIRGEVFTLDDINKCRMEIMRLYPGYDRPITAESGIPANFLRGNPQSPSERNTIFRFTNIRSSLISGHRMGRYA